jgi:hypothetical protein
MSTYIDTLDPQKVLAATDEFRENRADLIEQAGGDVRFALYLYLVDRVMCRKIGLGHRDLADYTWRDAYENGTTPREAASDALENNDTFAGHGF